GEGRRGGGAACIGFPPLTRLASLGCPLPACAGRGPRSARPDRRKTGRICVVFNCQTARASAAPGLVGLGGGPVSFLPLAMRGVTRREDALSGSRRTARTITPGGPGSPDPGASADAPRQLGAPRRISGFTPSTVRSDRPAVLVPREGSPPPPGDVVGVDHARGCRVPPHFTTPHESAPQVDGRIGNISLDTDKSTVIFTFGKYNLTCRTWAGYDPV